MREPAGPTMTMAFPKPGRVLKATLITLFVVSIAGAVVANWAPGPPTGPVILEWLSFDLDGWMTRPWTLLTSGLITSPKEYAHVLYSLIGLYFLTPDLESRWGGARLLRFFIASIIGGNLLSNFVNMLPLPGAIFHMGAVMPLFGPGAAIAAVAIAWARENWDRQLRFYLVLPLSGRVFFWITIGFCVLGLVYYKNVPEGAFAPFGGVLVGILFSGSPSPVRAFWLRIKLFFLRRQGSHAAVQSIIGETRSRPAKRSKSGPSLRVVQGGIEDDDLKNRKPPKDKRELN